MTKKAHAGFINWQNGYQAQIKRGGMPLSEANNALGAVLSSFIFSVGAMGDTIQIELTDQNK